MFGFAMKVTTNSQLLSSLTSLIDPNQRQQQVLQEQQEQKNQAAEQAKKVDRQGRIDANRTALKNLQERLKADNLEKLKTELSQDSQDNPGGVNLNLRESLGTGSQPVSTRPGQIIDIRV